MPPAGGPATKLAADASEIVLDATSVFYVDDDIYSVPRAGGSATKLRAAAKHLALDGDQLYFMVAAPNDAYGQIASRIQRMNKSGGEPTDIFSGTVDPEHEMGGSLVGHPVPDGKYLYFTSLYGVYRMAKP